MEEARQEPAARRAVRVCRICVDLLQSPAAVEPCGHIFCLSCIQPRAAPDAAGTCPMCREPIAAIRPLPQERDERAGLAPRRRRRLHPFVLRWRQRQQREQWEQAAPGGGWHQRFSDGDREQSPPVPQQRVQRVSEELDRNGPGQDSPLWPPRERERRAGLRGPPAPPPLGPI